LWWDVLSKISEGLQPPELFIAALQAERLPNTVA
jgi:hypothetical protein